MKILHLISSGGMYGAEAVILDLSRCLQRSGHRSEIGVFANSAHPNLQLEERAHAEALQTHRIPCRGQLDLSVATKLRGLVQRTGADVVHAHGYKADVYAYWALRAAKVPLVSTCHTWYDNDLALRVYGALDRFTLKKFQRVVTVSEAVRQRLLKAGVEEDRIHLIRNGADMRPFASARSQESEADRAPTVGLVGRLAPEKGVDLFLRAAARVVEEFPSVEFMVVGDGPDRAALQGLIQEFNLQDRATLLGRCENMPAFYAGLDILVSASRQEGLPIALLEGMASGLPVVATRAGEVPSLVQTGRTGVLVDVGDVAGLATAISSLLREAPRRALMGAAGRALVAGEFSADRMSAEYLDVYLRAVAELRP